MSYWGELPRLPNLVGLWHLNGNSQDASGNGRHGTDTSITYGRAYGKFDQGALFDGTNSIINVGAILPSVGGILFWMNPVTIANGKRPMSDTGGYLYPEFQSTNAMRFMVSYSGQARYTGNVPVSTGVWAHWAVVWGDSGYARIYKNGVLQSSVAAGSPDSTAYNFQFGGITVVKANVRLDEIAMFSAVPSAAFIRDWYEFQRFGGKFA